MQNLIQLKSSDIAQTRDEILQKQNGKCAICGCVITDKTGCTLDHQHKLKSAEIGIDGAGLIRGVLCQSCNIIEGRIHNSLQRYKQSKTVQDRIDFLQKLIQYYQTENYPLIHPSEKDKTPIVSKKNYNKLYKQYMQSNKKGKFPEYPKSKKLTKKLEKLFSEFNIEPYN